MMPFTYTQQGNIFCVKLTWDLILRFRFDWNSARSLLHVFISCRICERNNTNGSFLLMCDEWT